MKIPNSVISCLKKIEKLGFLAYISEISAFKLVIGENIGEYFIITNANVDKLCSIFRNLNRKENFYYFITDDHLKLKIKIFSGELFDEISKIPFSLERLLINSTGHILDTNNVLEKCRNHIIGLCGWYDLSKKPEYMISIVRMCCENNLDLDEQAFILIKANAAYIKKADKRKVCLEMERIIKSKYPEKIILLHSLGLLKYLIPELDRCFGEKQKNKYHIYDVGEHILHAFENTYADDELRWAALLHDVGKPLCKSVDSNGIIHFFGHHIESSRIANRVLINFNVNEEKRNIICRLIDYHDVRFEPNKQGIKKMLGKIGEIRFEKLLNLQDADSLAKNPKYIKDKLDNIQRVRDVALEIIEKGEPYKINDLAIGKRDLINMKFRAEREIRDTLRILLDEVIEDKNKNDREYLLRRAKEFRKKRF